MELWFSEQHTPNVKLSIKVRRQLYHDQSEFQQIDIFDTYEYGRILVLDGILMLTESDEFIYHEMLTHVPMAVNPSIQDVLVIGGGDGGVVRELCHYNLHRVDLVEIDRMVVDACKQHIVQTACMLDKPHVNVVIADGLRFVRGMTDAYDLIVVDSTDPFGPGEGLFTKEFYGNCYKALRADGILVNQMESPYYANDRLSAGRAYARLSSVFPIAQAYQAHIPTYPSGHWLFGFASKTHKPLRDVSAWDELHIPTTYYNTELHYGCFALPNYVKEIFI